MCRLKDFPASTLLKEGYYLSFSHKNVSFSSIFLCLCTPIPSKWFFKKLMPWQFMFDIALVLNIIRSILKVNIAPRLHMISLYRVHSATGIVVHWWLTFIKESSGLSTKEPDIHQFIEARIALWVSWVVQTVITQNSRLQVFIWTIMMISFAFLQKSSLLRAPCQATFPSRGARKTAYAKYLPFHCWLIPDIPVTGRRLSIIKNKPLNEILAQSPPQARLGRGVSFDGQQTWQRLECWPLAVRWSDNRVQEEKYREGESLWHLNGFA